MQSLDDYGNMSNYVEKSRVYYDYSLYGKKSTFVENEHQIAFNTTPSFGQNSQVD